MAEHTSLTDYSKKAAKRRRVESGTVAGQHLGEKTTPNDECNTERIVDKADRVLGQDNFSDAMRSVYRREYTVYTAAKIFKVDESTLRRRIKQGEIEKDVKKGRKFQVLESEESNLCNYLEWLSCNRISKMEINILDEVKQYFDLKHCKTDFEDNRPGHGWYTSFLKRNEDKLSSHSMSPLRKKIIRQAHEMYETMRTNCLLYNIDDRPDRIYLTCYHKFQVDENMFMSIMVLLNCVGDFRAIVCHPLQYDDDEVKATKKKYEEKIKFMVSRNGSMTGDDFLEALIRIVPTFKENTAVVTDLETSEYSFIMYDILQIKKCFLIAIDPAMPQLLSKEKHFVSQLRKTVEQQWYGLNTEDTDSVRVANVKLDLLCDTLCKKSSKSVCALTCEIYGIYPMGSYWMMKHAADLQVKLMPVTEMQVRPRNFRAIMTRNEPSSNSTVMEESNMPHSDRQTVPDAGPITRRSTGQRPTQPNTCSTACASDALRAALANSTNNLMKRVLEERVCLKTRPRRSKVQMAADKQWKKAEDEMRKKYKRSIEKARSDMKKKIDKEKKRRQFATCPTKDPSSEHYLNYRD